MAKVYVGTSGFSYPHWGKGVFYPSDLPQRDWFLYYTKHFDTVELNVSFYRLPKKETFVGWRKKAGSKFVFSVKGSRYITHIKRLKDCREPVKRFFQNAEGIKAEDRSSNKELGIGNRKKKIRNSKFEIPDSKDAVLWQLPPRLKANVERLNQFLKFLPKSWRHAFEFRHESWLAKEVYKLLKKYKTAIVFQDNPGWPIAEEITADFVYLRFHGKTHLYTSCYTEKELKDWAKKIRGWIKKDLDCYTYFNNDALGHAVENAQKLRQLVVKSSG